MVLHWEQPLHLLLLLLAAGGELGTAAVYMYELAPSRARSKGSSIIFVSVTAGILLGIVVTMILTASTTTGDSNNSTSSCVHVNWLLAAPQVAYIELKSWVSRPCQQQYAAQPTMCGWGL